MPQLTMTTFLGDVYVPTMQALTMGPDVSYQWGNYKAVCQGGVLSITTVKGKAATVEPSKCR